MYYSKIETLSNCVFIRKDLDNGKTLIFARVFFHDYDNDQDAIDFAENLVKLLN
jgi:hypothetical protein